MTADHSQRRMGENDLQQNRKLASLFLVNWPPANQDFNDFAGRRIQLILHAIKGLF